jgi:sigma-E factor negative regulatory protein RseC
MEELGRVVEVKGNLVKVVIPTKEACKKCGACLITALGKEAVAEAENKVQARVGDMVKVEIKEKIALTAAFILYGIPLVLFFLGYFFGLYFGKITGRTGEGMAVLFAFLFLLLSFLLIRLFFGPESKRVSRYYPVATEIIEEKEERNGI